MEDREKRAAIIEGFKDDVKWFSNANKEERERWVVEKWAAFVGRSTEEIIRGCDPPDYFVGADAVEVVEVLPPGRKRHSEYKNVLSEVKNGQSPSIKNPDVTGTIEYAKQCGHIWLLYQVLSKIDSYLRKGHPTQKWILLAYLNIFWPTQIKWNEVEGFWKMRHQPFARLDVLFSTENGIEVRTIPFVQREIT